MGEIIARAILVVLEYGFEYVGYHTARVLIPVVTAGRCKVANPTSMFEIWAPTREEGLHPITAAMYGTAFWLLVATAIFLCVR